MMNKTRGYYFNELVVTAYRFSAAHETHYFLKARGHIPKRFLAIERAELEIVLALYKAGQWTW